MLYFKAIILITGLFATFAIIPFYRSTLKIIEADQDYLFFPSLIFWFISLEIFLLWLFMTLISQVVHPQYFLEKIVQVVISIGMVFNLFYILIVGLKYKFKYKEKTFHKN